MKSRINKVRKDLRALKSSSHAIKRLIEVQGIHFMRINALERLPKSEKTYKLLLNEQRLISALGLTEEIEKNEEMQKKYMEAISSLDLTDRAMVLDCYLNGESYCKMAMIYGFSESGLRKHIDRLIKRIAEKV